MQLTRSRPAPSPAPAPGAVSLAQQQDSETRTLASTLAALAWSAAGEAVYSMLGAIAAILSTNPFSPPRIGGARGMLIYQSDQGFANLFLARRGMRAITLGRIVIATQRLTYEEVVHESTHLQQVDRLGPLFLVKYLQDYKTFGYWDNPEELEAFAAGRRFKEENPDLGHKPYPY